RQAGVHPRRLLVGPAGRGRGGSSPAARADDSNCGPERTDAVRHRAIAFRRGVSGRSPELLEVALPLRLRRRDGRALRSRCGGPVFILAGCWSGPLDEAEEAVRPLRELTTRIADLSGPMPFVIAQSLFDAEYPDGRRNYWKSLYLSDFDDAMAELCDRGAAG